MDPQPMSPNSANSAERQMGPRPDQLQAAGSEVAAQATPEAPAAPEMAPVPGATPPPAAAATTTPPKLTAADVAAAIAAVPGPAVPAGTVPTPTVASDVDVIEPEWVDKAEEAVRQHQGDPYGEEEAIEALNQDYLLKRYGHHVGNPNVDSNKPEGK